MFKRIIPERKITFESFLSCMPARDYVFQSTSYDEQIKQAAEVIKDAEYCLIGAGAGLSAAAGAQYGGKFFEDNFEDFQKKYGNGPYMQDMYSAGFYPYPDEEAYWGYWSKQAMKAGIEADHTELHKVILEMLDGKQIFVLSTNADGQFTKAGLSEDKIFCTQGDYFHIQCARGCHQKIYDAVALFRQMDQARKDCRIPSDMVPKCPVCKSKRQRGATSDGRGCRTSGEGTVQSGDGSSAYNTGQDTGKQVNTEMDAKLATIRKGTSSEVSFFFWVIAFYMLS